MPTPTRRTADDYLKREETPHHNPLTERMAEDLDSAIRDMADRKHLPVVQDAGFGGIRIYPPEGRTTVRFDHINIWINEGDPDVQDQPVAYAAGPDADGPKEFLALCDPTLEDMDWPDSRLVTDADQFLQYTLEDAGYIDTAPTPQAGEYGPTSTRMVDWYNRMCDLLAGIAEDNRHDPPPAPGDPVYLIPSTTGEDDPTTDAYVTDAQMDEACPKGLIRDRFLVMSNSDPDFDRNSLHWADREYWRLRVPDALRYGEGCRPAAYPDPWENDAAVQAEIRQNRLVDRLTAHADRMPRNRINIQTLHLIVEEIDDQLAGQENPTDIYRPIPSETAMGELHDMGMTDERIAESRHYGGWDPDRDPYVRFDEDGDLVGLDHQQADDLVWDNRRTILAAAGAMTIPAQLMAVMDTMDAHPTPAAETTEDPLTRPAPDMTTGAMLASPDPAAVADATPAAEQETPSLH